jgi:hypothetical protein
MKSILKHQKNFQQNVQIPLQVLVKTAILFLKIATFIKKRRHTRIKVYRIACITKLFLVSLHYHFAYACSNFTFDPK